MSFDPQNQASKFALGILTIKIEHFIKLIDKVEPPSYSSDNVS